LIPKRRTQRGSKHLQTQLHDLPALSHQRFSCSWFLLLARNVPLLKPRSLKPCPWHSSNPKSSLQPPPPPLLSLSRPRTYRRGLARPERSPIGHWWGHQATGLTRRMLTLFSELLLWAWEYEGSQSSMPFATWVFLLWGGSMLFSSSHLHNM
jgi:hypothetical protein